MKLKKLFIGMSTIAPMSLALSFVSCDLKKDKGENIYTDVNTEQKFEQTKAKIATDIQKFYENATISLGNEDQKIKALLKYIKENIGDFADPLARFLIIIDSQNKKFLDFFYNKYKKSDIPDISIHTEKKYSQKTIKGINKLVGLLNDVIEIREKIYNETEYKDNDDDNSFLSNLSKFSESEANLWSDHFEKLSENSDDNFFEKIGNNVLSNEIAKNFWNKFIDNYFHENYHIIHKS